MTKERKVRCIIELNEYKVPKSYVDKLDEYNNYGEYEAYNSLIDEIVENYEPVRRIPNVYYRK